MQTEFKETMYSNALQQMTNYSYVPLPIVVGVPKESQGNYDLWVV